MAKRANPFSEDFVQQSKVHVGLKQFNHSEERLQKVYEKTLEILFKGAKKAQQNCIKSDVAMNCRRDGLKQLFIGTNGSLLHSGQMKKENMSQKPCKCGGVKEELCAYCEKTLCVSCEHTCTLCKQNFCSQCSLSVSEGPLQALMKRLVARFQKVGLMEKNRLETPWTLFSTMV